MAWASLAFQGPNRCAVVRDLHRPNLRLGGTAWRPYTGFAELYTYIVWDQVLLDFARGWGLTHTRRHNSCKCLGAKEVIPQNHILLGNLCIEAEQLVVEGPWYMTISGQR